MTDWIDELALVHLLASITFIVLHLVSGWAMFGVRATRDRERLARLLAISSRATGPAFIALLVSGISAIALGIVGGYVGRLWWWAAVVVLIAVGGAMTPFAGGWLNSVRHGLGLRTANDKKDAPDPVAVGDAELAAIIESGRPTLVAAIGLGGIVVLIWLMNAKPF